MRTTMKDIARECKVSVATVSIALSGSAKKGRISESKLEEIRQTARRLNYFPNSSASNLARGRSQTIGVVINDIRNSHIAELDTAISEVLQERGYSVVNHIFMIKMREDWMNSSAGSRQKICVHLSGQNRWNREKQTRTGCFMRP